MPTDVDSIRLGTFDVLKIPLLGRLLRSQLGRFVPQVVLTATAVLVVYDGFTGPQLAPANAATVISWILFRGAIIVTLLFIGNLFCMACPFTLTRTLGHKLSSRGSRWPKLLRNKWISIGTLLMIFWLYEWLDLWAKPALTAWIVIAYFVASFTLETIFSESAFCKYVCPLGAFNFVNSTIAPLQIRARDSAICAECEGKECVNGSGHALGCGTDLFVPMIDSNMDCTLCLDCSRACPYDNVGLIVRKPFAELVGDTLRSRWDHAFLFIGLSLYAILNAFGMVSPMYALLDWLKSTHGIQSEGIGLLIVFGVGVIGLTAFITYSSGRIGSHFTGEQAKVIASRYATAFVPLGAGIWIAHYGFHFSIGALSIIPVLHRVLLDLDIALFGSSVNWNLGSILPMDYTFPMQVGAVLLGFFTSLYILGKTGIDRQKDPDIALKVMLPWAIALMLLTILALSIFNTPMEMRGIIAGEM